MSQFAFNPCKAEQKPKGNIQSEKFFSWTQNNFYRTSYATMRTNVMILNQEQIESKNAALTGYAGFIPGMRSDSKFSKSYTKVTKESFGNQNLGKNTYGLSSTGFNTKVHDFVDKSKHPVSHKYGSSSIIKNHPCCDEPNWQSQTKDSFKHPTSLDVPTYRQTDKFLVNNKQISKQSGYQSNINVCDGEGWAPHKILNGDRVKTNYRIDISRQKPVHRDTALLNLRKHVK